MNATFEIRSFLASSGVGVLVAIRTLACFLRYRGTSLIRNSAPLGPYSRTMPLEGTLEALAGGPVSYERGTPVRCSHMPLIAGGPEM